MTVDAYERFEHDESRFDGGKAWRHLVERLGMSVRPLDEHRHAGLLSREYRTLGLGRLGARHWRPIRDLLKTVDVIGNEQIDPAVLDGTPLGEVYRDYRAMLHRYHFLTFSQLITLAVAALDNPGAFARVHGPLRHLIVDEYQDIDPAQERLIQRLAGPPVELCVVGGDGGGRAGGVLHAGRDDAFPRGSPPRGVSTPARGHPLQRLRLPAVVPPRGRGTWSRLTLLTPSVRVEA